MMALTFRILYWLFLLAYIAAVALWALGSFGLFGVEPTPFASVYLIVLGQPWVRLMDFLPEKMWTLAVALSPLPTLLIFYAAQRFFR